LVGELISESSSIYLLRRKLGLAPVLAQSRHPSKPGEDATSAVRPGHGSGFT